MRFWDRVDMEAGRARETASRHDWDWPEATVFGIRLAYSLCSQLIADKKQKATSIQVKEMEKRLDELTSEMKELGEALGHLQTRISMGKF